MTPPSQYAYSILGKFQRVVFLLGFTCVCWMVPTATGSLSKFISRIEILLKANLWRQTYTLVNP